MGLEEKLKLNTPADDSLAIFKSSASMLTKKKDQKNEAIAKLNVEKLALEKIMFEKEQEYSKQKGGKYLGRDDFRQFAANLRAKNATYKNKMKNLSEIKQEVTVLNRTK